MSCVYLSYLASHPYPAFGAGLFLNMAEQAVRHPMRLPKYVPHYTDQGVPFAYPPLMFYVNGLLVEVLGVDPIALSRHLPTMASLLALVPFYLLGEELLESRREAGLATVLVAVSPPVLQWQISAGGIVRGPTFFFVAAGLYTGLRLFRDGGRRWLALSTLWFTLTVLTHPVYTAFFGLTYVWMFLSLDRTVRGFQKGVTVAAVGFLSSAPWWSTVISNHGPNVFTGAAGTHGGIGQRVVSLLVRAAPWTDGGIAPRELNGVAVELYDFTSFGTLVVVAVAALMLGPGLYLLATEDDRFLTGWLVVVGVFLPTPRFLFAIGSLIGAAGYFRFVLPAIRRQSTCSRVRTVACTGLTVAVLLSSVGLGVAYTGGQIDAHGGSESLPQFIDDEDREAMEWASGNTTRNAEFVVLGDAAEWFPQKTNRTILVGPWGVEWRGQSEYDRHLEGFGNVSTCESAACLDEGLEGMNVSPDYVYVPKGEYTVRGMETTMPPEMRTSLIDSPRYDLVHENEGVMVFEYDADERREK